MTDGPDVLLSATLVRPEEKQLITALRDRGATVAVAKRSDLAAVLNGGRRPDLALIRNLAHSEAEDATTRLAAIGVRTVNTAEAVRFCGDKGQQALVLGERGIAHPVSYLAYDVAQAGELVRRLDWRAVIKPVSASWGRGLTRIVNEELLDAWTAGRESVDAAGKSFPVLVQEYLEKPGYDLRVVVVGREPVVSIKRVSAVDWRTNTHLGATVEPTEVTLPVRRLVSDVLGVVGPGFYGVDIVVEAGTERHLVLEVNANPEFAKSAPIHGVDIAGLYADFVLDEARGARPGHSGDDTDEQWRQAA